MSVFVGWSLLVIVGFSVGFCWFYIFSVSNAKNPKTNIIAPCWSCWLILF